MNFLASPWIPLAVLVMLALLARFNQRSWLAPSAFAPMIWSFYILIPLLLAPDYEVSGTALWIILLLVMCIQIGATIGENFSHKIKPVESTYDSINELLRFTKYFCLMAIAGAFYLAYITLRQNDLPYSLEGILALGHILSVARYAGEQDNAIVRLLIMWMYPAAFLGGIAFVFAKSRFQRAISISPFVPALLIGVFQSVRAPSLIVCCCWLSAFFAAKAHSTRGYYQLFNRRLMVLGLALAASATCLFIVLDSVRVYTVGRDFDITPDWDRVRGSMFAYLPVFSGWAKNLDFSPRTYGIYTFAGLFNALGLHPSITGLYEKNISFGNGGAANIYTAFRGLIQDFSLPGAAVACLILGVLAGLIYSKSCEGRRSLIAVLAVYYCFLLWSPIVSLSIYDGIILAWIVAGLVAARSLRNKIP